ncbi:MAG: hypothetical protein G01um101433_980 [Parcubacteria group bacterium Gr01-1014_33]|nr:MAG: hypothetical protein G01um101433_980 [Parcubacteria group bacterium Gr01-1014_33]
MAYDIQNEQESASDTELAIRAGLKVRHPMEALLKSGVGAGFLKVGEIVEGEVIGRKATRMFIDLGMLGTGIVYGREYYAAQDIIKGLSAGDRISAKVVEQDNEEGYVELSLQEAGRERRWVDLRKGMENGETLELKVEKANTGGLILQTGGIEGFLPASQLSYKNYPRVDGGSKEKIFQELQKLVGQTLKVKILDLNPQENKLILTEKGLDQETFRSAVAKYHVGDIVEGEITSVVDFGAFMKFGDQGLEGLIHLSEIDWSLIEDPRQALKPGERMNAKIIDIQGEKISLSLKQLKVDPWIKTAEKYQKGAIVTGKVTKFNPFGAFVEVERDIQGLIHISEFGTQEAMRRALELGKEYMFKIILIEPKEHRMSLGLANPVKDPRNNEDPAPSEDAISREVKEEAQREDTEEILSENVKEESAA